MLPTTTFKPPPPTLSAVTPASAAPGSALSATFTGSGFRQFDTYVTIDGGGVVVTAMTVKSATEITADITVDTTAATGPRHIRLTTSGGTTEAQLFAITSPEPRVPSP